MIFINAIWEIWPGQLVSPYTKVRLYLIIVVLVFNYCCALAIYNY